MCGIVGYIGKKDVKDILLTGLKRLEYRGYDSSGIGIIQNGKIHFAKVKGDIENLKKATESFDVNGFSGIGHTRWATHGEPSAVNSHPHFNKDKTIAVVHNGIIENHEEIKNALEEKGYNFISQTDTEVLPHLIDYFYDGSILDTVIKISNIIEGSYAIAVLTSIEPDKITVARKNSPLSIAQGESGFFVASDIHAVSEECKKIYYPKDGEFAILTNDEVTFYDSKKNVIKKPNASARLSQTSTDKSGYNHFMLKEMYEQPKAIQDTLDFADNINLPNNEFLNSINKIYITGCGTAYHAGITGKIILEKLTKIPTDVQIASELRYQNPIMDENTLLIAITQSGETADTLDAIRLAKESGAKVLSVTNVEYSTASRESDFVFYTQAGPEIAVASTKTYTTQLCALYILAIHIAKCINFSSYLEEMKNELKKIPDKIKQTLDLSNQAKEIADIIFKEQNIFYLGRGLDLASAMEGSLKLKEISYIHSEAYAAGELKHGPIALIDKGTPVIAINTSNKLRKKTDSNVRETVARGAFAIGIMPSAFEDLGKNYNKVLYIPKTDEMLYPLLTQIPLQLLAYHIAVNKDFNPDKPRNLAKSVTVE